MLQTNCLAAAGAVMVIAGWAVDSIASTLHVPGDFATIQACINAAVSGVDECVVAPGTYHETINFFGKAITLRSSGGADVTTIDATGIGGSVVTCISGEGPGTVLDAFTITGGTGTRVEAFMWGGGMYNGHSSPTVTDCNFSGNTPDFGGGMANNNSSPTVTNCTFRENSTRAGGGAMFNYYSSLTVINNCRFIGNTATAGGGVSNHGSSPTVTNCMFSGNTGTSGGGMYNWVSSPTVTNCTFSENTATVKGRYGGGGGMKNVYYSSPIVTNSILWGDSPDQVVDIELSASTFRFSDVQGGLPVGEIDGGGNIDLDPMFVRPPAPGPDGTWDGVDDDYGDLRLQAGSPCINAGNPNFTPQPGETDLDGHARVLCGRVDVGAYEFGIGDYDCDQTVDLTDFAAWNACMTSPLESGAFYSTIDIRQSTIGCAAFDFDGDGDVDFRDFAAWQIVFSGD